MSQQIKLYYAPGACSLAPHMLLRILGIDFEAVNSMADPNTYDFISNFHLINPKMRVPVLVIGSETITETPAIFTAISQLVPEKHLFGTTPIEVVRAYEWLNYLSGYLHGQAFGGIWRAGRFSDDPAAIEGIKEKALLNIKAGYEFIEGKLTGVYAVGEGLTVVDAYLLVFYRWALEMLKWDMTVYAKYTKLVGNLLKLDAVKETLKIEEREFSV